MSVDNLIDRFGTLVELYQRSESVDAGGALTKTYSTTGSTFLIYLQPSAPSESMVNGAIRMTTNFTAYIKADDYTYMQTVGARLLDPDAIFYEITGFRIPDKRVIPDSMAYYIVSLVVVEGQS
jgi:hypothetical protein